MSLLWCSPKKTAFLGLIKHLAKKGSGRAISVSAMKIDDLETTSQTLLTPLAVMRRLFFISMLGLLVACGESPFVQEVVSFSNDAWHQDSIVKIDVNVSDTQTYYRVSFQIRHTNDYPYSNLYLFREIRSETATLEQDTIQIQLANEKGEWLGNGVGDLKTLEIPYKESGLRFPKSGTYRFRFQHGMRDEPLLGIRDFTFTIEDPQQES